MVRVKGTLSIVRVAQTAAAALALASLVVTASRASVPPHTPGTICYTPTGWCWAKPPGPAGSKCRCPGPANSPVEGIRG